MNTKKAIPMTPAPLAGPLAYRPFKFDDWGMIRNADGELFAVVRRPISEEEADEHRKNKTDPFEDLGCRLIASFASLASPLPAEAAVARVKQLEWERASDMTIEADCLFGLYSVTEFSTYVLLRLVTPLAINVGDAYHHKTIEAAKAAAQADYDRRILSALTQEATPAGDMADLIAVEPVAWQCKDKHGNWITLPGDWQESENLPDREYRALVPAASLASLSARLAEVGRERETWLKNCELQLDLRCAAEAELARAAGSKEAFSDAYRSAAEEAGKERAARDSAEQERDELRTKLAEAGKALEDMTDTFDYSADDQCDCSECSIIRRARTVHASIIREAQ